MAENGIGTIDKWISRLAIVVSVGTMIFWIGVDHQRIVNNESRLTEVIQELRDINVNGTAGTHQRLDDLQKNLDRLTDLTLEDLGKPPLKRGK